MCNVHFSARASDTRGMKIFHFQRKFGINIYSPACVDTNAPSFKGPFVKSICRLDTLSYLKVNMTHTASVKNGSGTLRHRQASTAVNMWVRYHTKLANIVSNSLAQRAILLQASVLLAILNFKRRSCKWECKTFISFNTCEKSDSEVRSTVAKGVGKKLFWSEVKAKTWTKKWVPAKQEAGPQKEVRIDVFWSEPNSTYSIHHPPILDATNMTIRDVVR